MPVKNTLITFKYFKESANIFETRSGIFKKIVVNSDEKCSMLVFDTDKMEYRNFRLDKTKDLKYYIVN